MTLEVKWFSNILVMQKILELIDIKSNILMDKLNPIVKNLHLEEDLKQVWKIF